MTHQQMSNKYKPHVVQVPVGGRAKAAVIGTASETAKSAITAKAFNLCFMLNISWIRRRKWPASQGTPFPQNLRQRSESAPACDQSAGKTFGVIVLGTDDGLLWKEQLSY